MQLDPSHGTLIGKVCTIFGDEVKSCKATDMCLHRVMTVLWIEALQTLSERVRVHVHVPGN